MRVNVTSPTFRMIVCSLFGTLNANVKGVGRQLRQLYTAMTTSVFEWAAHNTIPTFFLQVQIVICNLDDQNEMSRL